MSDINNTSFKVLVCDDEPDILELLKYNLEKEGYKVETAESGQMALKKAAVFSPDLVLLDIMMPNMDGVETCRQLRSMQNLKKTHITFLTARAEEYSEIAAFEVGADDYITKPVKPRALMSRISALFRREFSKQQNNSKIEIHNLTIDRDSFSATVDGRDVSLPKKEFELLHFLASNPDKVFNRDELLDNIWGTDVYVLARTVDVHIRKLREKIGEDYIKTIKGVGYKFIPE